MFLEGNMAGSTYNTNRGVNVNILLAIYNGEKYLQPLLDSIKNQTHTSWKLIIRDNCSTNSECVQIILDFKKNNKDKVVFIQGTENLGSMMNFSYLLDKSNEEYTLFADGDDIWMPDKIEKTINCMLNLEKSCGKDIPLMVHTDLIVVDSNLNLINNSFWRYQKINPANGGQFNRALLRNVTTGCTVMINRALQALSRPIPKEAIMHDWWLALVACAFGKIAYIGSPTILYRQHENNDTGAKKWSFRYVVNKAFNYNYIKERLKLKQRQASAFLERYDSILSHKQKKAVNILSCSNLGALEKRYQFILNDLCEDDILKNIGLFLYM
jgi:glycosyltransferase involved in cell wall biosynthesis